MKREFDCMKRFTIRDRDGQADTLSWVCDTETAMNRLAEYEETGLQPWQVKDLMESLDIIYDDKANNLDDTHIDFISMIRRSKELMQADKAGRVVIIPDGDYTFTLKKE